MLQAGMNVEDKLQIPALYKARTCPVFSDNAPSKNWVTLHIRLCSGKTGSFALGSRILVHAENRHTMHFVPRSMQGFQSANSEWVPVPVSLDTAAIKVKWHSGGSCTLRLGENGIDIRGFLSSNTLPEDANRYTIFESAGLWCQIEHSGASRVTRKAFTSHAATTTSFGFSYVIILCFISIVAIIFVRRFRCADQGPRGKGYKKLMQLRGTHAH